MCAAVLAATPCAAVANDMRQCDIRRSVVASAPSILSALAPAWAAAFAKGGDSARIEPPYGPPQGALDPKLREFLVGRRDAALITREVAEADLATFRTNHDGRDPLVIPVAAGGWDRFGYVDAVAVIVHRSNPLRALSFRQIDAIFSVSRLRGGRPAIRWGDLGLAGLWRTRTIRIVGGGGWAGEESARALTMRRHVLSVGSRAGRWRPAPGSGGEAEVVERVGRDPAAIGFTGMGHLSPDVRAVAVAAPGSRAVLPSLESARTGSYPLLRTVDLLIDPADRNATSWRFARFLLSPAGQAVARAQDRLMPLPPGQLAQARRLVERHACVRN